ncbi:MAG: bifunctional sugar-1-phosphate nucleotidylyltransferase/acetyltransferase [Candidatus Micrarchaeota archaeon]
MKAVVLAAGEGKRLRPLTYTKPKCMIEIAGKPILWHVLQTLKSGGIKEATIVVKYMKELVTGYFGDGKTIGMKLDYVEQGDGYGTGAAFLCAEKRVDDTFFGMAGDIISDASSVKALLKAQDGEVTVGLTPVEAPKHYGIAEMKGKKITSFEEKPEHPKGNLANGSMYVFDTSVFKFIGQMKASPRGEFEITDVIARLAKEGKATGVKLPGYWLDMGMPWHLFEANEYLLGEMKISKRGKIENTTVKGKLIMEEGARIFDSYVEGTVYVGKNAVVGPHAYLRGTTSIGDDCSISDSTTIKNSILFNHVNAKHLAYIGDSIVGERTNFGAGTQIANFRFDEKEIGVEIASGKVNTTRRKLGAIIGDGTKFGVLSCVMPGLLIGDGCWIGSGVVVTKNIPRKTKVLVKQNLIIAPMENGD